MILLTMHILEQPTLFEPLAWRPGYPGQPLLLQLQLGKTAALDTRCHAGKTELDHFGRKPHRFKQL